jgi:hypothetical protein
MFEARADFGLAFPRSVLSIPSRYIFAVVAES